MISKLTSLSEGRCFANFTFAKFPLPMVLPSLYFPIILSWERLVPLWRADERSLDAPLPEIGPAVMASCRELLRVLVLVVPVPELLPVDCWPAVIADWCTLLTGWVVLRLPLSCLQSRAVVLSSTLTSSDLVALLRVTLAFEESTVVGTIKVFTMVRVSRFPFKEASSAHSGTWKHLTLATKELNKTHGYQRIFSALFFFRYSFLEKSHLLCVSCQIGWHIPILRKSNFFWKTNFWSQIGIFTI